MIQICDFTALVHGRSCQKLVSIEILLHRICFYTGMLDAGLPLTDAADLDLRHTFVPGRVVGQATDDETAATIAQEEYIRQLKVYRRFVARVRAHPTDMHDDLIVAYIVEETKTERRLYATEWMRQPNIVANATKLRETQPAELTQNTLRFVLDSEVPDHLCIEEIRTSNVSRRTWVRGLVTPPDLMFISKWHFTVISPMIFRDYYATIKIDLSSAFSDWKKWTATWARVQSRIYRLMIDVKSFDDLHIFALAEIAYFFANSRWIGRLDTFAQGNDVLLSWKAASLKKRDSADPRPDEHIIVNVRSNNATDHEISMYNLFMRCVCLGRTHRNDPISREGLRKKMFDWVTGPVDFNLQGEQALALRGIDRVKYPTGTTYSTWLLDQPKSSPNKRRAKDMSS